MVRKTGSLKHPLQLTSGMHMDSKRGRSLVRATPAGFRWMACAYIYIYPPVNKHSNGKWKIPILNRKYIFKWWIFHCYVRLPECIYVYITKGPCWDTQGLSFSDGMEKIPSEKRNKKNLLTEMITSKLITK